MKLTKVSFAKDPERIAWEPYSCIWVYLAARKNPSPLKGSALEWIDWKLQGQISRFLFQENYRKAKCTFIPTMRRLASPYVALEASSTPDWKAFFSNSEGMNLKRVLCLCEDQDLAIEYKKALAKQKTNEFPEVVAFAQSNL